VARVENKARLMMLRDGPQGDIPGSAELCEGWGGDSTGDCSSGRLILREGYFSWLVRIQERMGRANTPASPNGARLGAEIVGRQVEGRLATA
jgi:hypothetical protein